MTPLPAFSAPDADSREAEHGAALSEIRRLARRVHELEAAAMTAAKWLEGLTDAAANAADAMDAFIENRAPHERADAQRDATVAVAALALRVAIQRAKGRASILKAEGR